MFQSGQMVQVARRAETQGPPLSFSWSPDLQNLLGKIGEITEQHSQYKNVYNVIFPTGNRFYFLEDSLEPVSRLTYGFVADQNPNGPKPKIHKQAFKKFIKR